MSATEITLATLAQMKDRGEKIAVLTCYDATFTRVLEEAGVEVLLVGDSLGMVIQGHPSTLPVDVEDMVYHARSVARARKRALLVCDLPFMSFASPAQALETAAQLMKRGGAQVVKLEGGAPQLETVRRLSDQGIPVCGHLGLLPQSVHKLGGYRVQGRDAATARRIEQDAVALEDAGAAMLVLECVPAELGAVVSRQLRIPVIGIGAGPHCDGQVLVLHDMLGITPGRAPRFVRDFLAGSGGVSAAVGDYVAAVKDARFPGPEHCFE